MKKFYLFFAAALMALVSCSDDPETPVRVPEIVVNTPQITVDAEEASYSFAYEVVNPSSTGVLTVESSADWLVYVSHTESEINYGVTVWENSEESRSAVLTLKYPGAEDVQVTVVQLQKELAACPVEMYILDVSYYYANITWLPSNDDIQYLSFVMEKSVYDGYESETKLFEDDLAYLQSRAASLDISLEDYLLGFDALYSGGMTNQVSGRKPNTEYVVYCYSVELRDGTLVRTSAVGTVSFKTKELVMHEADFNFSADMHSNRMTLSVTSGSNDFRFGVDLFTESEYAAFGSPEEAASELIRRLATYVNMGGMSWDQVTYLNQATKEYPDLVAGRKYYAVACGVDDGTLISNVAVQEYTVPMPEITDNCTFTVDFTRMAPTEVDFTVTPTNAATRYLAVIDEAADLASTTREAYAAELLYRMNYYDAVDWTNTSYLFTGEHTFNSHSDVVNPEYLKAETDYVLLVFGVDGYGERTTEIFTADFTTPLTEQKAMTIDIQITSVEARAINAVFTPSDETANYHYDAYPIEDYEGSTPEEFMEYVISINGEWLSLYQGTQEHRFSYYFPREEYVVFAFGYDGAVTSDLYLKHVNMTTGEVTEMGVIPQAVAQKYLAGKF